MHLLINLITALVLDTVGFRMYVYFFSLGYGLSVAGIGTAMLVMFRDQLEVAPAIMCCLFIAYGLRLGLYLLLRELKNANYKKLLKDESKSSVPVGVKVCIWIACALLFLGQTAPVLFRLEAGKGSDGFALVGILFMVVGILMELAADMQKNKAKKVDPHRFVDTGLYRLVRCPNYLGELILWTGVFVSGLPVYQGVLQWTVACLGYIGILYVLFSGARRLELRQDRNYGKDPAYQKYVTTVPIMLPFVPLYSVKKHKWLVA